MRDALVKGVRRGVRDGGAAGEVKIVELVSTTHQGTAAAVDIVLEVTDDLIPTNAGRWRVRGSAATATCEATTEEPDVACDIRALGAAYLGGTPLTALADAGLVRERRPGALATASTAFAWHQAPSLVEAF